MFKSRKRHHYNTFRSLFTGFFLYGKITIQGGICMLGYFFVFLFFYVFIINILIMNSSKRLKYFYYSHAFGLIVVCAFSVSITWNSSGGVNWPWWLPAIFYSIPIVTSFLVGFMFKSKFLD